MSRLERDLRGVWADPAGRALIIYLGAVAVALLVVSLVIGHMP